MHEFDALLSRHLAGTATHEERKRLLALIRSGQFDKHLEEEIQALLQDEWEHADPADQETVQQIFDQHISPRVLPEPRVFKNRWVAIGIAASIACLITVSLLWPVNPTTRPFSQTANPGAGSQHAITASPERLVFKDRQFILLPDSSKIWLNSGSELSYNQYEFGRKDRTVTLSGEAFFDIHHNAKVPFRVKSGKITTSVLGTAFNIRTLENTANVVVTVSRGRVEVANDRKVLGQLVKNEELRVKAGENKFEKKTVVAERATAWINEFLIFENTTLSAVISKLEKRFGKTILVENPSLLSCTVSVVFYSDENLEHILKVIGAVNRFTTVQKQNGEIVLMGDGNCQ